MDEVDQNELIDLDISQADLALFLGAASAIRSSTPVGAKSSTGDGGVLDSNASDAAQASENVLPSYIKAGQRGEQIIPAFLVKTYEIVACGKFSDCIGWSEDGEAIRVFDCDRFAEVVLPLYFKHSNYTSFVRQLNMYAFTKTRADQYSRDFAHAFFKRGRPDLLPLVKRKTNTSGAVYVFSNQIGESLDRHEGSPVGASPGASSSSSSSDPSQSQGHDGDAALSSSSTSSSSDPSSTTPPKLSSFLKRPSAGAARTLSSATSTSASSSSFALQFRRSSGGADAVDGNRRKSERKRTVSSRYVPGSAEFTTDAEASEDASDKRERDNDDEEEDVDDAAGPLLRCLSRASSAPNEASDDGDVLMHRGTSSSSSSPSSSSSVVSPGPASTGTGVPSRTGAVSPADAAPVEAHAKLGLSSSASASTSSSGHDVVEAHAPASAVDAVAMGDDGVERQQPRHHSQPRIMHADQLLLSGHRRRRQSEANQSHHHQQQHQLDGSGGSCGFSEQRDGMDDANDSTTIDGPIDLTHYYATPPHSAFKRRRQLIGSGDTDTASASASEDPASFSASTAADASASADATSPLGCGNDSAASPLPVSSAAVVASTSSSSAGRDVLMVPRPIYAFLSPASSTTSATASAAASSAFSSASGVSRSARGSDATVDTGSLTAAAAAAGGIFVRAGIESDADGCSGGDAAVIYADPDDAQGRLLAHAHAEGHCSSLLNHPSAVPPADAGFADAGDADADDAAPSRLALDDAHWGVDPSHFDVLSLPAHVRDHIVMLRRVVLRLGAAAVADATFNKFGHPADDINHRQDQHRRTIQYHHRQHSSHRTVAVTEEDEAAAAEGSTVAAVTAPRGVEEQAEAVQQQ